MTRAITAEGTQVFLGPTADLAPANFVLIGELASMTPVGREWDVNDVTSFTSPTKAKEKIKGLLNPGQYNLVGNRIFDDASQAALQAAFEDPINPYWFQVIFPVNPYTLKGETWTFAALVLSIDPPKIAPNKALQFFTKLQATGARITSTGYTNAGANIIMTRSRPLESGVNGALWSNFSTPVLPRDGVIQGIFPVILCSATHDQAFSFYKFGAGLILGNPTPGQPFVLPSSPGSATFASTEFYFVTPSGGTTTYGIGTSLSDLDGQEIIAFLLQSLFRDGMLDAIAVTGVGFAVYYSSSNPVIDAQMPAPFTVPAGQGVAWSLPFTVESLGLTGTGNTVATAAALIGL